MQFYQLGHWLDERNTHAPTAHLLRSSHESSNITWMWYLWLANYSSISSQSLHHKILELISTSLLKKPKEYFKDTCNHCTLTTAWPSFINLDHLYRYTCHVTKNNFINLLPEIITSKKIQFQISRVLDLVEYTLHFW